MACVEVDAAGQQPLEDGADAADLLDRFVGDVNDGLHAGNLPIRNGR